DIYSLGVVLYEMATGRVPFQAETDLAVALAHVEQTPAAPRALNARLAPDLERTILRALAKSPEMRFSSAAEFADALQTGGNGRPAPPPGARRASESTRAMSTQAFAQPTAAPAGSGRTLPARRDAASASAAAATPFARHTARPKGRGASNGMVGLLVAMAAVL